MLVRIICVLISHHSIDNNSETPLKQKVFLIKKIYQKIKDKLKGLTKIAKRRNKVIDIVDYEVSTKAVKLITSLDKDRLGFKPDKGQNQWTRSCQNSGSDKKRRPQIISNNSIDELQKNGYKLNPNTKYYENN